jgi:hypothetical protein
VTPIEVTALDGLAELIEKVDRVIAEQQKQRLMLAELRAALVARRRPSRRGLLATIAATVEDRAFNSLEVIRHAEITPRLAAALEAAQITNARALGKWFRAIEGRAIDGHRLERIGIEHDGAIVWRVV